jgi:hypothetical protein
MSTIWPQAHIDEFKQLVAAGLMSFSEIAETLTASCGRFYTRNACIGKSQRLGLAKPVKIGLRMTPEARTKRLVVSRRLKRWARNPGLEERYDPARYRHRAKERKGLRARFLAGGVSKTSPMYRKHMPRLGDLTKLELRAMLALAVANTAAMELRPE